MSVRRLLVTGGAGFIGSHFIRRWLATHPDDQVVNYDLLTYAGSRERLVDLNRNSGYQFLKGNICDALAVRQALNGCQLIVHLAAETHVDRSITNAAPFLRTNVEGTHVLLEEARRSGVTRVVHISTDEVYGPVPTGAVDERAPLAPRSPYAASKAAGDLLTQAFHHTYGLPTVVVRPTNIFGPGQFPEKFMPVCITHGLDGLPVPLYGDGQQRRSWLYIDDVCEALRLLVERGAAGEIYNIAGGSEQANADTARLILKHVGRSSELIQSVEDRPGHDRRYAMTDAKLRALGWRPTTSFEQGVASTVAWYREHVMWWRPLVQTLREDPYHWLNRATRASAQPPSRVVR